MNFRTKNGFRDLQVALKELDLYAGSIDGAWGKNTSLGTTSLLQTYAAGNGRSVLDAASLPMLGGAEGEVAIKALQGQLVLLGLYPGDIDGIWGNGTRMGIELAKTHYRRVKGKPSYDIAWSKKVSAEFVKRVKAWCFSKGFDPRSADWLMACMHFESAGTFSPSIQNKAGAQAFGLIQFMKGAAKDLGYTLDQIRAMDQLTQLEQVFKYFEFWMRAGKRFTQLEDFYLTIFYPAAVGMKADQVLFDSASPKYLKSYTQNKGFDTDKDGKITIGEISTAIYQSYYDGMNPANRVVLH